MVVETPDLPFLEWFQLGSGHWLIIVLGVAAAALVTSWLVTALQHGPLPALRITGRVLAAGIVDLARMSPRRVWALSWLAFRESIRRRVVVVFVIFILILLFAGWFLDPGSSQPARLYLVFVLTAISYLVLLLALFLSTLSLPADIKNKTLHTVVTKPVRSSEIVFGRMLGFTAIGTLLLSIMGVISYVFVDRGLSHTHELAQADLDAIEEAWAKQVAGGKAPGPLRIRTSKEHGHRHEVTIRMDRAAGQEGKGPAESVRTGRVRTETEQGHWHELSYKIAPDEPGKSKIVYEFGPPRDNLVARVPLYGKLHFKDRAGKDAEKGVNVGDEWTYRSFIDGGTLAAAIWTFDGITESNFPKAQFAEGLPLEMTLEVFRTTKGDTDDPTEIKGTLGSLAVRRPETGQKPIEVRIFRAKDFAIDTQRIPRKVETPDGRRLDLFEDVAADGKLEVWLRSVEPAQYLGVAQADVYLRARDASFVMNLAKGYLGIWLQMILVIGIGVMFSTFLSGPIALVATLGTLVGGFFSRFMADLAAGQVVGGGPVEAFIRLVTQQNVVTEMEPGMRTRVAQMLDQYILQPGLWLPSAILPEFGRFSYADHVAYGFDISINAISQCALRAMAFLLPVFVAGYFFLKTREVAR